MTEDWARPVVAWEIQARDAEALRRFYAELFNWQIGDGPVMRIPAGVGGPQPGPIGQIRRVVQRLGADTALAFLQEVQQIEANGGLMLPDGSRRRTPGGVYFHLVRQRVSKKDRSAIFFAPAQRERQSKLSQTAAPAADAAPTEPEDIVIPHATGEVRTVKITVIGRPGRITRDPRGFVTVAMQQAKLPALPKGVPAPPAAPTSYTVYIAQKQWNKVADGMRQDSVRVAMSSNVSGILGGSESSLLRSTG